MNQNIKVLIPSIKKSYDKFTNMEKTIADFFLNNKEPIELTSRAISAKLFVSEASLSRFAKKCGLKGFREFLFYYEKEIGTVEDNHRKLINDVSIAYQLVLNEAISLVREEQFLNIVDMLYSKRKIFIYGIGYSGLAANEFKFRFMELGIFVEVFSDLNLIELNSPFLNEDCIVIGITVSGQTSEINGALKMAYAKGAYTIAITENRDYNYKEYCREVLYLVSMETLNVGNQISPQYPILVLIDLLYSYFLGQAK